MLRIEKLRSAGVRPYGLSLFKPNPMFFKVSPVFPVVPLKPHLISVFYCIYKCKGREMPIVALKWAAKEVSGQKSIAKVRVPILMSPPLKIPPDKADDNARPKRT
jgi:hypothetical protein